MFSYKFNYPGGREASYIFPPTRPGKKCLAIAKFVYPGGRDARLFFSNLSYRNTTNSHPSISTKPGTNYLIVQELAAGFFFHLDLLATYR